VNRRSILILGKNRMDLKLIRYLLKIKEIFTVEEIILNVNVPQSIYITPVYYWKKSGLKIAANEEMNSWWASFGIGVDYSLDEAVCKADVLVIFDPSIYLTQSLSRGKMIIISNDTTESGGIYFSFRLNEEILLNKKLIIPDGLDYAISYFSKVLLEKLEEFKIKTLRIITNLSAEKDKLYNRLSKIYPNIDFDKVSIETSHGNFRSTKDKKAVQFEVISENKIETQKFINSLEKLDFIAFTDRRNIKEVDEVEKLLVCEYNIFYPFIISIPFLEVINDNMLRGTIYVNPQQNEIFNVIFALVKFFFPHSVNDKISKILKSSIRRI